MTAKEKAWELYPNPGYSACESYEEEAERCGKISGFVAGADWMLEKACEYIRSQYPVHYQEWYELAEERVKQFKKAMEE